ncbi:MAG: biotin transporter BioY [Candidatus Korobacteraceae bacterium]
MLKTALHTEASVAESSPSLIKQAGIVIGASAVIAVCARLVIPLPFTPVPLTLANFGVLLIGLTLGSRRGFAAAAVYLGWGAIGLPVFSMVGPGGVAQLFGSTAGYLWAYPVVAFVAGWIAERGQPGFVRNVTAGVIAELVLFAGGVSWLAAITHSWQRAAFFGLYPFLVAELLKVTAAAAAAFRLRRNL